MNKKQEKQRNIMHNMLRNIAESIDIDKLNDEAAKDVKKTIKVLRQGDVSPKKYALCMMNLAPFSDIEKRDDPSLYKKVYDN